MATSQSTASAYNNRNREELPHTGEFLGFKTESEAKARANELKAQGWNIRVTRWIYSKNRSTGQKTYRWKISGHK